MIHVRSIARLALLSLLCGVAASAVRAQTGERREAPATISGRVEQDGGGGLRGIVVALLSPDATMRFRVAARAKTDADGRYTLSDVPPGRHWILPRAAAYVFTGAGAYPPGRQVIVEAGEVVDDFDIKLARGGVITGRVTDAEGKPLVREPVDINFVRASRGQNTVAERSYRDMTDDRGIYRVYGLPAGGYRVSAGRVGEDGFGSAPSGFYRRVYYPGTAVESEAKVVEVSAGGEVTGVDITLDKRVKTFRVSGRVVAEGGEVVPGVRLEYAAAERGESGPAWGGVTQSDARGQFQLDGVAPGHYLVYTPPDASADRYGEAARFEVTGADVAGIEVRIRRAATLNGSVRIEGTSDRAKRARLMSQIKLDVNYEPRSWPTFGNFHGRFSPAADGSFRVGGLGPGLVQIGAGWPPVKGLTLLRVEYEGEDRSRGIVVGAGAQVEGVVAVYAYGDASVRGQVNVINGALPPQTRLTVYVLRPGGGGHFSGRPADVDARGHFTVGGLPSGDYELVVQAFRPGLRTLEVRQHITLPEDGETAVTLTLDAGGEND